MSSSESDDAPDSVSFTLGKETALQKFKDEKSKHKFDADKEWRKKRELQYKEQKEKKLLSYDILMEADKELEKDTQENDPNSSESEENEVDDKSPTPDFSGDSEGEVDQPVIEIAVLNVKKPKKLAKSPLDFKQEAMYGKRIKRVDATHSKRIRAKRRANLQRKSAVK